MEFQPALDDFLLYLEVEQNYSKNTVESYESDLTKFLAFLQRHNRSTVLQDITPSLVRRFIQQETLQRFVSPRTMQRRISSLRYVLPILFERKLYHF
ncbi:MULTISPECIES: site-specific integrase [Bacillus]|uniref:site-specific integrase n=1 Tax=Bacillus TaxID=1386 RepID=UPI000BB99640|nr:MULTISPECIES: site-specific integrase [Bacillus]